MTVSLTGGAAPDFTLVNQHGTPVTLSALRGAPVLVVFIPHAFSPVCTTEILDLRDSGQLRRDAKVTTLTIACDSVFSLKAWAESTRYADDVLSDFWPHGEVARAYGVFDEKAGQALRASFLVDAAGTVAWGMVNPEDAARPLDAYQAAIDAL